MVMTTNPQHLAFQHELQASHSIPAQYRYIIMDEFHSWWIDNEVSEGTVTQYNQGSLMIWRISPIGGIDVPSTEDTGDSWNGEDWIHLNKSVDLE